MFDFKSLLNEMEQSRRRSLLSVGVVCFLALALIIGLGVFSSTKQLRQQPSASPTMTGRELFNKVIEQEKNALEKQAELEAQQAKLEVQQAKNTPLAAPPTKRPTQTQAPASSKVATPETKKKDTETTLAPSSPAVPPSKATSTDKEDPYFNILHEPWPPSSAAGTTKVESTFVPRLGSMFLMLCITCTIIWLSLKIFAPLFSKFTRVSATPQNHLQIIEKKALAPNKMIVLIETHGQHILLGITDQAITTLANFDLAPTKLPPPTEEIASQKSIRPTSEASETSEAKPLEPNSNPKSADPLPGSPGEKKNLLKEVISQHFSSLPLPRIEK